MGQKVVYLHGNTSFGGPGQPVREVIERLEEALERARSGELRSVVVAGVLSSGASIPIHWNAFSYQAGHLSELMSVNNAVKRRLERLYDGCDH